MEKGLLKLQEEILKFGGYRFPEDIRSLINENSSNLKMVPDQIPIDSPNSPIVQIFSAIVTNPKTVKLSSSLVSLFCDSISQNLFSMGALISVLSTISLFSQQVEEIETALKFLPFYSSLLPKHFLDIQVLQILFSSTFSFLTHPAEIVSSTAFASSQQMISHLFNYIFTEKPQLNSKQIADINSIISLKFEKPLFSIAYLILYDLSAQLFDKPLIWLHLPKLPLNILFKLWELIIKTHHEIIQSEQLMLDIIESSAVMPIVDFSELPFLVSLNRFYLACFPSLSISLFSYFLQCSQSSDSMLTSLIYFRSLFFCSTSFIYQFTHTCDTNGTLLDALLDSLDKISNDYVLSKSVNSPLRFSMSPLLITQNCLTNRKLLETAPFEISLSIISSLASSTLSPIPTAKSATSDSLFKKDNSADDIKQIQDDDSITVQTRRNSMNDKTVLIKQTRRNSTNDELMNVQKDITPSRPSRTVFHYSTINRDKIYNIKNAISTTIINLISSKLLKMLVKATRYADEDSCGFIFDAFHQMLNIYLSNSNQEGRALVLRILCGLAAKQRISKEEPIEIEILSNSLLHKNKKGLCFQTKHQMSFELLENLLYDNPRLYSRLFLRLFMTFSSNPSHLINPSFTLSLETCEVSRLCSSVIKGNSFCIDFISSVLVLNTKRFDSIFKQTLPILMTQITKPDTQKSSINLISDCLLNCFNQHTEMVLLELVSSLISNESFSIDVNYRLTFLIKLRNLISNNSIVNGWSYIIKSIHNYEDETIEVSSSILNLICNNFFSHLDLDKREEIIKIIFEYASQKVLINVALSSLGLLWVVVPFIKTNSDFWKLILSETIILFSDSRNDVAVCSVQTFFSLLSTNSSTLPKDIYSHLIRNCFMNQLMAMGDFSQSMWSVQQLILQEMCHCAISFWSFFISINEFSSNFWELIIAKHESFLAHCQDQEINNNAFLFYEECFSIPNFENHTRYLLTVSFENVVLNLLKREPSNSLVITNLGRFISKFLLKQKLYLTVKLVKIWINIVKNMLMYIPSETFINLSVDNALKAFPALFPFENDVKEEKLLKAKSQGQFPSNNMKIKSVKSTGNAPINKKVQKTPTKTSKIDSSNKSRPNNDSKPMNMEDQSNNEKHLDLKEKGQLFGSIICHGFIDMIIENAKNCVRETIISYLFDILNCPEVDRISILIECKPLFYLPSLDKYLIQLLTMADSISNQPSDSTSFSFFECLTDIANDENKTKKVTKTIEVLAVEKQINFVKSKFESLSFNLKLWLKFCDPTSPTYSQEVSDVCFDVILDNVRNLFELTKPNEKQLLVLLKFIYKAKSPPKNSGSDNEDNCDNWHLNKLMPDIRSLINDSRVKVAKMVNRILKLVKEK